MCLYANVALANRRRTQIQKSRSTCAEQHDLVIERVLRRRPV